MTSRLGALTRASKTRECKIAGSRFTKLLQIGSACDVRRVRLEARSEPVRERDRSHHERSSQSPNCHQTRLKCSPPTGGTPRAIAAARLGQGRLSRIALSTAFPREG